MAYFSPGPESSDDILQMASEDGEGDASESLVLRCCCSEGSYDGCALGVVCFLSPPHVGLDSFPGFSLLPGDYVACGAGFCPGSVGE